MERNKSLEGKELVLYLVERFNYSFEKALKEVKERKLINQNEFKRLTRYNRIMKNRKEFYAQDKKV
jgi:hypothetical protein